MIGGLNQRADVGSGPGAPPLGPQRRTAAATHRPADRPVPPSAISGITYRYEQAVRSAAQITPIADSARPRAAPPAGAAARRTSGSARPMRPVMRRAVLALGTRQRLAAAALAQR